MELSDKLKKVESELASKLSDYNKELENSKRLSSEIVSLKELHRSKIEELEKSIEVSYKKNCFVSKVKISMLNVILHYTFLVLTSSFIFKIS